MQEEKQNEIIELEFPHCVRIRPGMYLPNITHMLTEIIDNSLDEYSAGFATMIAVYLQDDFIVINDNGRGLPIAPSKKNPSITQAELAACTLHAGGKFNVLEDDDGNFVSDNNKKSVKTTGLHGVGLSVVNALSEWLVIRISTGGKKYEIAFEKGIKVQDLIVIEEDLELDFTGTEVIFKPDSSIWKEAEIDIKKVNKRLKTLALLNPGLITYLQVSKDEIVTLEETYQYENGLLEFIKLRSSARKEIIEPIIIEETYNEVEMSIALVYTDSYEQDNIISFCNNASTTEHGDHVEGFKNALTKAFNNYILEHKLNFKLSSSDIYEGLMAIVSIKVRDPFFVGQGKASIEMLSVKHAVKYVVENYLKDYLDHNPNISKILLDKMSEALKARVAAQKAREAVRKIKETSGNPAGLAGKIAHCTSKKPEECEIFIVEGDSAGGSAKQARNRSYQAILPIFGKVLNVEKKRLHDVVNNNKLTDFFKALGCGISTELDLSKLKYHKVIITSDADIDGSHIKTLWLTFVYRYMREIIENGHLYFSCPPLYKGVVGKETFYIKSDIEKQTYIAKYGNKITFQRFKGLGEMSAEQLWETTMNPETRTLEKITIEDIEADEYLLSLCMGEDVAIRKQFIMDHAIDANTDI